MDRIKFPHIFPINIDLLDAVRTDDGHIWGYEKWLVNDPKLDIGCKLLIIFPGFGSSIHGHVTKCEYFHILAGDLTLSVWQNSIQHVLDELHCSADGIKEKLAMLDTGDIEALLGEQVVVALDTGQKHFIERGVFHGFKTGTREFTLLLEVSTFEDEKTVKLMPSEQYY